MNNPGLIHLSDPRISTYEIGGKATQLVRLLKAGFPISQGWVIPTDVFNRHLVRSTLETLDATRLDAALLNALTALPDASFAVRSSASVEDGIGGSYSGLFETQLCVCKRELPNAIRKVWASAFRPEAVAYHRRISGRSDPIKMAVVLTPMVNATASGVVFSANPVDGNPFRITVTACHGLGAQVVNGAADLGRYILDWDVLALLDGNPGKQKTGQFVDADGTLKTRAVPLQAPLSGQQLHTLGETIKKIDAFMDCRVDVEFAFDHTGLVILQARPIVNLPRYFPNNPSETGTFCCHQTWRDPLSPFGQALVTGTRHPEIQTPPWPWEASALFCRLGRVFARSDPNPEYRERPDASWKDRTFLKRMEHLGDPENEYRAWWQWTKNAYQEYIPSMRQRSERLLAFSESDLDDLDTSALCVTMKEALDLEHLTGTFYIASSYPTAETLRRVDIMARDWITNGDWKRGQDVALTMIQGTPKLTYDRDAELQDVANDTQNLDTFIQHWGYSYLVRDEQIYLSRWRSWREDPGPLHKALEQMRASDRRPDLRQSVRASREKSEREYARVHQQIETEQGAKRAAIFAACVCACRGMFCLKDDRDVVWSHAQSALRWILMAAGRRLAHSKVIDEPNDIFLFMPDELIAYFDSSEPDHSLFANLARTRREEQRRLARYTGPLMDDDVETKKPSAGSELKGEPATVGIAEGRACLVRVDVLDDVDKLQNGDIMVLIGEGKIGWTMFFQRIAGLIYDRGNWLCHETNLCRELGIPAVVGLNDVHLLRDGERLRIDGGTGLVYRLEVD